MDTENKGDELHRQNGRPHDNMIADQLLADVDAPMRAFLDTVLDSVVKWDLLRFFGENPHTYDTAESITRYTGRSIEVTRTELSELVARGVLDEESLGSLKVYTLTKDPEVRELVLRFSEASRDRRFRLQALYATLRRI